MNQTYAVMHRLAAGFKPEAFSSVVVDSIAEAAGRLYVTLAAADEPKIAVPETTEIGYDGPSLMPACCDDPRPRISNTSGRLFCASCRHFLSTPPEPPSDDLPEDREDDADDEEGDPS